MTEIRRSGSRPGGMVVQSLRQQNGWGRYRSWDRSRHHGRSTCWVVAVHVQLHDRGIRALALGVREILSVAHLAISVGHHAAVVTGIVGVGCSVKLLLVEELSETADTVAGEHAKDVALVVIKLRRRFATKGEEFIAEEGLNASEGEMGQFGAVVEKHVYALEACQCLHKLLLHLPIYLRQG